MSWCRLNNRGQLRYDIVVVVFLSHLCGPILFLFDYRHLVHSWFNGCVLFLRVVCIVVANL